MEGGGEWGMGRNVGDRGRGGGRTVGNGGMGVEKCGGKWWGEGEMWGMCMGNGDLLSCITMAGYL